MFLASNRTCAVYFTKTAHVQLLAKNMAGTHVHAICTRHLHYVITKTPYAFVAKITLCMYLLYVQTKAYCMKLNVHYNGKMRIGYSRFHKDHHDKTIRYLQSIY